MKTQEETVVLPTAEPEHKLWDRIKIPAVLSFLAGPLMIVGSVLVVLNRFIAGRLFPLQVDVRSQWLPYFCFFGRSLRSGHLPAWNPHVFAGLPSAADPQMGWLNAPAMGLFATLPCDSAMRWYLIAQPILAGLGMYWFLRSERMSRPSATVGGLVLAVPIAGSGLFGLPWLSGALAWSAIVLAAASRWVQSDTWPGRLGWMAVVAIAWGQLAAVHFSHGLAIGTAALLTFLLAKGISDASRGRRRLRESFLYGALLLVGIVLVNLAFLVPRLGYLPRTTQSIGYQQLDAMSLALSRGQGDGDAIAGLKLNGAWPLDMALSRGLYAGAAALALSLAAFWATKRRHLAAAFSVVGAGSYLLTVQPVYRFITSRLGSSKLAGLYMHSPRRFQFGLVLAVAVLAAVGLEAWRERRPTLPRLSMLIPGLMVWGVLLWISSAPRPRLSVLEFGAAAGAVGLAASALRAVTLPVVPLILAVELTVAGMSGQDLRLHEAQERVTPLFPPLMAHVDLDAYMHPGPISRKLQTEPGGRYISVDPKGWRNWGYTGRLNNRELGLMGGQRSMIFGLEEAQGYNPIEPIRYWTFVRTLDSRKIRYAVSYFLHPRQIALDLLDVRWVVGRAAEPPMAQAIPVVREGPWRLYRLRAPPGRVSVVTSWQRAQTPETALRAVTRRRFDPERKAIVEDPTSQTAASTNPGKGSASNRVTYRQLGPQAARVDVTANRPAVLVVRNSYDPNWKATLDGRPAPVFPTDYVVQGVRIPAGHHTVLLSYDDPSVGYGLLGSGLSLLAIGLAALVLSGRLKGRIGDIGEWLGRRRAKSSPGETAPS